MGFYNRSGAFGGEERVGISQQDIHIEARGINTDSLKHTPPPTPRDPVHTTAAYLVAYLGTFPKEKKDHLMRVAETFVPYLGLPQHEETTTDMYARVSGVLRKWRGCYG